MTESVRLIRRIIPVAAVLLLFACGEEGPAGGPAGASPADSGDTEGFQLYTYSIVNRYNHALDAYTQGLVFEQGFIYEGTGLNGESSVRQVELETGDIVRRFDLGTEHFGEGITVLGDSLIQLTLSSFRGFIYSVQNLDSIGEFEYSHFSWGLTDDGEQLIMSDGSDTLYFLSPDNFRETGRVNVYDESGPVDQLNELEYIGGKVFANVYGSHEIMIIDPASGQVTGKVNLSGIRDGCVPAPGAGVLNGIAYHAGEDRIFVTGKNWPDLFEIELIPVLPAERGFTSGSRSHQQDL